MSRHARRFTSRTYLGHRRPDRTATSMWVCWAYRAPRSRPYLVDLRGLEYSNTPRPHGMLAHCCDKFPPSSAHQSVYQQEEKREERIENKWGSVSLKIERKLKWGRPQVVWCASSLSLHFNLWLDSCFLIMFWALKHINLGSLARHSIPTKKMGFWTFYSSRLRDVVCFYSFSRSELKWALFSHQGFGPPGQAHQLACKSRRDDETLTPSTLPIKRPVVVVFVLFLTTEEKKVHVMKGFCHFEAGGASMEMTMEAEDGKNLLRRCSLLFNTPTDGMKFRNPKKSVWRRREKSFALPARHHNTWCDGLRNFHHNFSIGNHRRRMWIKKKSNRAKSRPKTTSKEISSCAITKGAFSVFMHAE